jgi:hypothetical protein
MTALYSCFQIGKKTEGEHIDPHPERVEGVALATFDLESLRWQRARYAKTAYKESDIAEMYGQDRLKPLTEACFGLDLLDLNC